MVQGGLWFRPVRVQGLGFRPVSVQVYGSEAFRVWVWCRDVMVDGGNLAPLSPRNSVIAIHTNWGLYAVWFLAGSPFHYDPAYFGSFQKTHKHDRILIIGTPRKRYPPDFGKP